MKKSICTTAVTVALFGAVLTPAMAVTPATASAAPVGAPVDISAKLLGKTVFLDPGHQGGGTAAQMSQMVDNGRGGLKPCETSGMTALGGMPEHTITWKVAELIRASLENLGAHVVMSRPDDVNWAGCITDRARAANASGASVAISIHADGAPAQDRGFHFIVPQLPVPNRLVNSVQASQGMAATRAVRDSYLRFGFQPANYAGAVDGLQTRSDIAGPALTTVPDVFVEMGNGANPDDATALTTPQGQLRHALAITTGLVAYLLGANPGGPVAQQLPPVATGLPAAARAAGGAVSTLPGTLPATAGTAPSIGGMRASTAPANGGPIAGAPNDLPVTSTPSPSIVPATRGGQIDAPFGVPTGTTDPGAAATAPGSTLPGSTLPGSTLPGSTTGAGGYSGTTNAGIVPALTNSLGTLTNSLSPVITPLLSPLLAVLGVQAPALLGAAGNLISSLVATLAAK